MSVALAGALLSLSIPSFTVCLCKKNNIIDNINITTTNTILF